MELGVALARLSNRHTLNASLQPDRNPASCKRHDMRQSSLISYAVRNNVERCPEERSDGGKERTR